MTNPLVAQAQSSTTWYTGLGLIEDAAQISDGIKNDSWVDGTLGTVGGALDVLGMVIDPLGSLVAWGVSWLMEHVKPLKEALDWLAGNPDEISAHAQTWENVAKFTLDAQKYYADALRVETADWLGDSGDAYRGHASGHLSVMEGISKAAHGIHYAVMGAGLIVGLVRGIVRDLIAQFIGTLAARLPQWLAEAGLTLGLATPVVIGQVVSLVTTWVNKIQKFVRALLSSLKKLTPMVKKLGEILEQLKELLKKLGRSNPLTRSADGPPPLKPGEIPGPRTSPANGPLAGRELDPHYRGETDPFTASNLFGRPSNGVRYFDEAGREQFRLVVDNQGRLRNASDGSLFDTTSGVSAHNGGGRAVFVMDQNGNLFASNYHGVGDFHHSSFLAGGDVASAGELTVRNGVLEGMNNSSGHYKPTQGHHAQARDELLAQGVQPGPNGLTEDLW
ncbi:hypothetical protein [Hamadaea sp.]|uniref:hypothetical protein n=1 Tax=Hamadaea sp. TaxID=2024425 RepID=UPI0025BFBD0B|nr:hypothetical protein [Hamadaea sp.]